MMETKEFLTLLGAHSDKSLLFEYRPGLLVGANYHITEVKHVQIDAVDCGARTDAWRETVIQLWEDPNELGKTNYILAGKAMGILRKVGRMTAYNDEALVRIEYGNTHFHTAQLYVQDYVIQNQQLRFVLTSEPTQCKAKDLCGVPDEKQVVDNTCAPGSGCC